MTFDLSQECYVQKLLLHFGWYANDLKDLPKDFYIQVPIQTKTDKIITEKKIFDQILKIEDNEEENSDHENSWKNVENFTNTKTQKDLGEETFAEFKFLKPLKTRFIRIFVKNNLGRPYFIRIGRVRFE